MSRILNGVAAMCGASLLLGTLRPNFLFFIRNLREPHPGRPHGSCRLNTWRGFRVSQRTRRWRLFSLRLIRLFLIGRALVMRHSLLCCCLKYPTPVITTTSCCRLSLLISVLLPPRLSILLRCRCCSYYYGYCYGRASAAVTMVISAVVSTSRSTSHCL